MSINKKDKSNLLEMKNISIEGFSDETWHPIIQGVNLNIKRGEVLGLIGESGAGKSTLGLAAMGFVRQELGVDLPLVQLCLEAKTLQK